MKILHINFDCEIVGGTESYLKGLMSEIEILGYRNFLFFGNKLYANYEDPSKGFFYIPNLCEPDFSGARSGEQVKRLIKEIDPDIIHVHNEHNPQLVDYLSRPIVKTLHTPGLTLCPSGSKLFSFGDKVCNHPMGFVCFLMPYLKKCNSRNPLLITKSYSKAKANLHVLNKYDKVIVASYYMKNLLIKNGIPSDKVYINPYFVYIPQTRNENKQTCDNVLPTLLFVGRITRGKGLQYLVHALKQLTISTRLLVVGDGDYLPDLKKQGEKMLRHQVEYLGWLSGGELSRIYESVQVVIMPSIWAEAFGIVGIEAMSHGKPVVAFDVGGIREWLSDGEVGYLVPSGNAAVLAERIDYLLKNPSEAQKLGEAGRRKVLKKFLPEYHLARLIDVYKQAIASNWSRRLEKYDSSVV